MCGFTVISVLCSEVYPFIRDSLDPSCDQNFAAIRKDRADDPFAFRGGAFCHADQRSRVGYAAEVLEFYYTPILLFLVGRTLASFRNDQQLAHFLTGLGIVYVVLGTAYELMGPQMLGNLRLRVLFVRKVC